MSVWPSVSVILRESGRSTMAGLEGREGVTGRCDKSSSAHLSPLSVTSWWRWDREMLQTVRCIHEWLVYTSLEWKPEAVLWPVIHDTPPPPPLTLTYSCVSARPGQLHFSLCYWIYKNNLTPSWRQPTPISLQLRVDGVDFGQLTTACGHHFKEGAHS